MSDNFNELLNKKYHKYAWEFAKDYIIYNNANNEYNNMKNNKINSYTSYYMNKGYSYGGSLSLSINIVFSIITELHITQLCIFKNAKFHILGNPLFNKSLPLRL